METTNKKTPIKLHEFVAYTPFNLHVLMDSGEVVLIDPYNIPRDILTTGKPILRPLSTLGQIITVNGKKTNGIYMLNSEYYIEYPHEVEADVRFGSLENKYLLILIENGFDVYDLIGRGQAVSIYGTSGDDPSEFDQALATYNALIPSL